MRPAIPPMPADDATGHDGRSPLERCWRRRGACALALFPLSLLFRVLAALRRFGYRAGVLRSFHPGVPVIVVGNIVSGGSGKTPFVAWLCRWLRDRGLRPGVVLRGYGGNSPNWPVIVDAATSPLVAGEEAVLLARSAAVPVVAGPDRSADTRALLESGEVDVIVCDDGLQHYALRRDFEIVLHDDRGHNGWCLPAGPLREPRSRLARADLVLLDDDMEMRLLRTAGRPRRLNDPQRSAELSAFRDKRVLAACGIARPERFFDMLAAAGIRFDRRILPDHNPFRAEDFPRLDYDAILLTEKDAIKCESFADQRFWWLPLETAATSSLEAALVRGLGPLLNLHG